MADNQLSARTNELPDDDPFAELTRIMGQGAVIRPRAVDEGLEDLGLDLEKELLADFGSFDSGASAGSRQDEGSQEQVDLAGAFGESDPASGFLDDFQFGGAEAEQGAAPTPREPEAAFDFDLDFGSSPPAQEAPAWDELSFSPRDDDASLGGYPAGSSAGAEPDFSGLSFDLNPEEQAQPDSEVSAAEVDPFASISDSLFTPRAEAPASAARADEFLAAPSRDDHSDVETASGGEPDFSALFSGLDLQDEQDTGAPEAASHDAFQQAEPDPFADLDLRGTRADDVVDHDYNAAAVEPAMEDELANALRLDADWMENDAGFSFDPRDMPGEPADAEAADEVESQTAAAEEAAWDHGPQAVTPDQDSSAATETGWNWDDSQPSADWSFEPDSVRNSGQEQAGFEQSAAVAADAYAASDYAAVEQSQDVQGYGQEQSWTENGPADDWTGGGDAMDEFQAFGPAGGDVPPEIETVEIPEKAVAVTDALDLPEVPYREDVKPAAPLDDIEELLAGAFGSLEQTPQEDEGWAKSEPEAAQEEDNQDDSAFDELLAAAGLAAVTSAAASRNAYGRSEADPGPEWNSVPFEEAPRPMPGTPPPPAPSQGLFGRRGVRIAALLAGVAIIGAGGYFALGKLGGGDGGEIALIRADDSPIKVKPENPGGPNIPNQDSQVYRQVAGETSQTANQSQLVTSAEEPIELPSPNDDVEDIIAEDDGFIPQGAASPEAGADQQVAKFEDRLTSTGAEEGAAGSSETFTTLTPRRVRSFVVRPDGTMVPREVETPAAASNAGTAAAGAGENAGAGNDLPGVNNERVDVAVRNPQDGGLVAGQEVPPLGGQANASAPSQNDVAMPSTAPIPAPRPAAAPRSVAAAQAPTPAAAPVPAQQAPAQPAPTQVAAAQPAAPAQSAASSGWSVQIASQPTLEAAQQSYQSLARRYGTMLQGKGVNIVKAEVPGKGTYYRVRIPAGSKNEAIALCEALKSQGGTCFVSQ